MPTDRLHRSIRIVRTAVPVRKAATSHGVGDGKPSSNGLHSTIEFTSEVRLPHQKQATSPIANKGMLPFQKQVHSPTAMKLNAAVPKHVLQEFVTQAPVACKHAGGLRPKHLARAGQCQHHQVLHHNSKPSDSDCEHWEYQSPRARRNHCTERDVTIICPPKSSKWGARPWRSPRPWCSSK